MRQISLIVVVLAMVPLLGCASTTKHDIVHYSFPEAQAELREALNAIIADSHTANVAGLRDSHLMCDKFTKFGGRLYDRLDYEQCTTDETANRLSVQSYVNEPKDVKIDVFGEVGIMTYYNHVTAEKDGKVMRYSSRQTLVFLKTADGWKIVHEHQSEKKHEE